MCHSSIFVYTTSKTRLGMEAIYFYNTNIHPCPPTPQKSLLSVRLHGQIAYYRHKPFVPDIPIHFPLDLNLGISQAIPALPLFVSETTPQFHCWCEWPLSCWKMILIRLNLRLKDNKQASSTSTYSLLFIRYEGNAKLSFPFDENPAHTIKLPPPKFLVEKQRGFFRKSPNIRVTYPVTEG